MSFDCVIGHKKQIDILKKMLASGKLPHSFIFAGIEGIGKKLVSFCFAKAVNCLEAEGDFCGHCLSCRKIDKQIHPDVVLIEPGGEKTKKDPAGNRPDGQQEDTQKEKKSNFIVVDQIRTLQDDILFKPSEGKKKIFIIDQAEKINPNAANCLLKTLEEPPADALIILVSSGTQALLPTVLSRCQKILFSPLHKQEVSGFLENRCSDHDRIAKSVSLSMGSIGRAIELLDNSFIETRQQITEALCRVNTTGVETVFWLSKFLCEDKADTAIRLDFLQTWYRDIALLKAGISQDLLYNTDITEKMIQAAERETEEGLWKKIQTIHRLKTNTINLNTELGLQSMFFSDRS